MFIVGLFLVIIFSVLFFLNLVEESFSFKSFMAIVIIVFGVVLIYWDITTPVFLQKNSEVIANKVTVNGSLFVFDQPVKVVRYDAVPKSKWAIFSRGENKTIYVYFTFSKERRY